MANKKISKSPKKSEACLCDSCAGLCCRYFALPIDNPDCVQDFDNIRWYLYHENVTIFVEESQWYIGIANRCKQLQPDNRCGIYLTRPKVCRGYSTDNCDYHGGDYKFELLFTSGQQLEEYAKKKLAELKEEARKKKLRKSKKGKPKSILKKPKKANLMRLADRLTQQVQNLGSTIKRTSLPILNG